MLSIESDEERAKAMMTQYQATLQTSLDEIEQTYRNLSAVEQQRRYDIYRNFMCTTERHLEEVVKVVKEESPDFLRYFISMAERHLREAPEDDLEE